MFHCFLPFFCITKTTKKIRFVHSGTLFEKGYDTPSVKHPPTHRLYQIKKIKKRTFFHPPLHFVALSPHGGELKSMCGSPPPVGENYSATPDCEFSPRGSVRFIVWIVSYANILNPPRLASQSTPPKAGNCPATQTTRIN